MATLLECQGPDCATKFEGRAGTKFCSATCRSRARRAREAAAANAEDESKSGSPAEHGLVKAVRLELEKAKAIDTVPGQLALQFARRMANPEESGLSAMSKELRLLLAEAKAETAAGAGADDGSGAPPEPEPEDDEVKKARRKREEIAAAAAAAEETA